MRLYLTIRNVLVSLVCSALGLMVCFELTWHEFTNGSITSNMSILLYAITAGAAVIVFVVGLFAMSWLPPKKKTTAEEEDENHKEYA